ncbi:MAG: glycosyltransferase family 39 protein [Terracidiphilus sp.]
MATFVSDLPEKATVRMNPRGLNPSPRASRLIAAALLVLLATLLFSSVRQESQTFDESTHLYAGFEYWKHADFGVNPEHPPLAKMLAALPLLPLGLKEPPHFPVFFFKMEDFTNGARFLYSGGQADALLLRARMTMALFSLALAALVYLAAAEIFGPLAGLLALGMFVFEPALLSNSALVTTDVPLTCLFFATVYAFYRFLKRPSLSRLALCALAAGLAMSVKQSGALVLPVLLLIGVVDHFARRTPLSGAPEEEKQPRLNLGQLAGALAAIGIVAYAILWTVYGFRYAARPGQLVMAPTLAQYAAGLSPLKHAVITFFARRRLFPEAYLYGWTDILLISSYRNAFIFGHVFPTGQWFFFPGVFLIKSTLTLMILLLALPFAGVRGKRREFLLLAIPVVFFMGISIASMLNMGVRHILPIYPFCILLAAAAASSLASRSMSGRVAVAALLALTVVSSLHAFPDYLAYSNEAFGGPANTWRMVADSNDDWGQGLKWTKTYLDQHPDSDCWLDYSSPLVNPAYYGIACKPLPDNLALIWGFGPLPASLPSTISGTVLISASDASGLIAGPDSLNPYQGFADRQPDAEIGNVILAYHGTFDISRLAALVDARNASRLFQQRRIGEALPLAQTAVQLAPNNAWVNAELGRILIAAGRTQEGQQVNANALRLAKTDHPEFQKSLIEVLEGRFQGNAAFVL